MALDYSEIIESESYMILVTRVELRTNYTIFLDNSLDLLEEMRRIEGNVFTREQLELFFKDQLDPEGEGRTAAFDAIHRPIIRKLNNYLSSCFAFRDYLYNLDAFVTEHKGSSEIRVRGSAIFVDSKERAFIQDLRNIYTHTGGLSPSFTIQYHSEKDGRITTSMYFCFKREKMLAQDEWSEISKDYIGSWPEEVTLSEIVNEYSRQVREHYTWTLGYYNKLFKDEIRDAYRNIAELNDAVAPSP